MTMAAVSRNDTAIGAGEQKAPSAFRTISEVATNLEVPQHVLRFWESKFQQVRPLKRGGGRRYYRPEDVQLLSEIKDLLYNQGFTIRGVQKLLRDGGRSLRSSVPEIPESLSVKKAAGTSEGLNASSRRELEAVLTELKALRDLLRQGGI
jgi:DNA-binding transcriptional MerR regulator